MRTDEAVFPLPHWQRDTGLLRGNRTTNRKLVTLPWQQKLRLDGPRPLPGGTRIYNSFHKEAGRRKPIS